MFDYPVTLRTEVPAEWKTCTVTQGSHSTAYPVKEGVVQYSTLPNAAEINIVPGGTPLLSPVRTTTLPPPPPSPPTPPVPPTRVVDNFGYTSDAELNSAWWVLPCGNETTVSLDPISRSEGNSAMRYGYAGGTQGISGRVHRNTSLVALRFAPRAPLRR